MGSKEQKEEYGKLNDEILRIKELDKDIGVANHKYRAMKVSERQRKHDRIVREEEEQRQVAAAHSKSSN